MIRQRGLQMVGDVVGDPGRAGAPREKFGALHEHRTDLGALGIVENRQVDRARDMVFGELCRATDVDDRIVALTGGKAQIGRRANHGP